MRRGRSTGPISRQFVITFCIFLLGGIFGCAARFFDIYTQNLGNVFSQMSVWVFLGTVISVTSATPLRAGANTFAFCVGMLAAYYTCAHLSGGVYSMTFVAGWAVFSALSPLFAFVTWYGVGRGIISSVIDVGILLVMALCSMVLFDRIHLSDVIIMAFTALFLFVYSRKKQYRA